MAHHSDLLNGDFLDAVFKLWKNEEGKSFARPPSFAMNILERLGHLNHWTESPSLLDEATTSIKELDAYQKFLKSHLSSIQEAVDALRGAVLPFMFGKGIDALPDEILSTIFETLETESYDTVTQTCSLVSRRFRRVVLNTPRLWCTVSNDMASMDSVTRNLERSKSMGLNVQLAQEGSMMDFGVSKKPNLDFLKVFDSVLAHTERWESFMLDIIAASRPPDLRKHLEKLTHLPRLKDISIHCDEAETQVEDPIFLRSLRAPRLHRLSAVNCLPGPSALTLTLTSLEFEIWNIEVESRLPHRLYTLLTSIPNLAEVSLLLDSSHALSSSDGEFPPYVLQNLKILKFSVRSIICDYFLSFRKALITPALVGCSFSGRGIEATCSVGFRNILYSNLLDFMLCHDEYPTVEALSIHLDPIPGRIVELNIPFKKVPNLRELTLDIHGFYPRSNYLRTTPVLRSLTVRNLGTDAWMWVKELWFKLRKQGDLPGLQKVVVGGHTVSHDWVEKYLDDHTLCFTY